MTTILLGVAVFIFIFVIVVGGIVHNLTAITQVNLMVDRDATPDSAAPLASAAAAWIGTRKVRREMGNNGGSTLRDAVDRIERRLTGIEDRLTSVEASTSTEEP